METASFYTFLHIFSRRVRIWPQNAVKQILFDLEIDLFKFEKTDRVEGSRVRIEFGGHYFTLWGPALEASKTLIFRNIVHILLKKGPY